MIFHTYAVNMLISLTQGSSVARP